MREQVKQLADKWLEKAKAESKPSSLATALEVQQNSDYMYMFLQRFLTFGLLEIAGVQVEADDQETQSLKDSARAEAVKILGEDLVAAIDARNAEAEQPIEPDTDPIEQDGH